MVTRRTLVVDGWQLQGAAMKFGVTTGGVVVPPGFHRRRKKRGRNGPPGTFRCEYCRNTMPAGSRDRHLKRCKLRKRATQGKESKAGGGPARSSPMSGGTQGARATEPSQGNATGSASARPSGSNKTNRGDKRNKKQSNSRNGTRSGTKHVLQSPLVLLGRERGYRRPYAVAPDGTVIVPQIPRGSAEVENRGRLRVDDQPKSREPTRPERQEDLRDATRGSGHSFRDAGGDFGSHPIHDPFDDESDP